MLHQKVAGLTVNLQNRTFTCKLTAYSDAQGYLKKSKLTFYTLREVQIRNQLLHSVHTQGGAGTHAALVACKGVELT